jgi:hypothetical protein
LRSVRVEAQEASYFAESARIVSFSASEGTNRSYHATANIGRNTEVDVE